MKTMKKIAILLSALSINVFLNNSLLGQRQDEAKWNFSKKDIIEIEYFSGSNFNITTGYTQNIIIELKNSNDPNFEYRIKEEKNKIFLYEDIMKYDGTKPTPKSNFYWNLVLPKEITIICGGANADIIIQNFTGNIINKSANCNAKVSNSKCNIEMSNSQSKVELVNCAVRFEISSSQGDLYANGVNIIGESSFTTGNGDVEVKLSKPLKSDLMLGSNFGTVTLNFNRNPIEGNFEFIARADKGKIVCPFKFDTEQVFKSKKMIYKNEADFKELVDYKVCSFIRGDQKPKVLLKTVTGKVKVIG